MLRGGLYLLDRLWEYSIYKMLAWLVNILQIWSRLVFES